MDIFLIWYISESLPLMEYNADKVIIIADEDWSILQISPPYRALKPRTARKELQVS